MDEIRAENVLKMHAVAEDGDTYPEIPPETVCKKCGYYATIEHAGVESWPDGHGYEMFRVRVSTKCYMCGEAQLYKLQAHTIKGTDRVKIKDPRDAYRSSQAYKDEIKEVKRMRRNRRRQLKRSADKLARQKEKTDGREE